MPGSRRIRKSALAAAILAFLGSLFVGNLIREAQVERVASVVHTFSRVFMAKIEQQLQAHLSIAEIARQSWESGLVNDVTEFRSFGETFQSMFADLQALNWVDNEGVIQVVTPLAGNGAALGLDLSTLDVPWRVMQESIATDKLQITPPYALAQGGMGIIGYLPVWRNDEIVGFVDLVFRVTPLIESVLADGSATSFHVTIADGAEPLFFQEIEPGTEAYSLTTPLEVGGRIWTATITPTLAEVRKAQTLLDEFVVLFGVVLSIGIGALLNGSVQNRETLIRSEERFALAMRGASDGLFDLDYITGRVFFSPRWFEMLGYQPNALPMNLGTFAELLHPDDAHRVFKSAGEIYRIPGDVVEEEFRMRHKNGHWITILSRACILRRAGKVARIVGTHVDISELRRQQSELERAATTDDLTGLRNRRGLCDVLRTLSQSLEGNARLALFHVDLDKFKSINDSNGHEAGDHVLKTTADRLSANLAFFDSIARVGGDEFLLAKKTNATNARVLAMATQVVEEISSPISYRRKQLRVGASIGIAFVDFDDKDEIDQATANADIALYTSKALGRGRCVFFEPGMRAAAVRTVELSSEIQEGLDRNEFRPFFQPQVDIRTNRIVGFEALARWHHPRRGVLSAAEFVSFAEGAHLLEAIDDRVFVQACAAVPALSELGAPDATVSVNVSTARLSNAKLVDKLIETTSRTGVEPHRIRIEILESTLLSERTTNITRNMYELADAGFKLELDDFGTGHTAIASLRNFPVSRIKIDRSLISGVQRDTTLQAISGAIIELGSKLGIEVLAEGIETFDELRYLENLGCSIMQGFLIAPPLSLDEMESWLHVRRGKPGLLSQAHERVPQADGRPAGAASA